MSASDVTPPCPGLQGKPRVHHNEFRTDSRESAGRGSTSYLTTFDVVMESGSRVWLKAKPRSAEATKSVESGETWARLPLAESVLESSRRGGRSR